MTSRRQFLGAAAAAAVLATGGGTAEEDGGDGNDREEIDTSIRKTLSLDVFAAQETYVMEEESDFSLRSHPADPTSCATIGVYLGSAEFSITLEPDQAHQLAEELHATVDDWHRVNQDEQH